MFDSEHDTLANEETAPRRRGIYLLPNLCTTAALFCGFFTVVSAIAGKFEQAGLALFLAGVFDGLDGRIARLTNTQSDFGKEYDSMSDLISFGMAPALLVYMWVLEVTPVVRGLPIAWLVTFFYVACAALRLARFNTQVGKVDGDYFVGLPSPTAAGLVGFGVWAAARLGLDPVILAWPMLILTAIAAVLMVSSLRFFSFKSLNFGGRVPFRYLLGIVLLFILIAMEPSLVMWLGALVYTVGSVVVDLRRRVAGEDSSNVSSSVE